MRLRSRYKQMRRTKIELCIVSILSSSHLDANGSYLLRNPSWESWISPKTWCAAGAIARHLFNNNRANGTPLACMVFSRPFNMEVGVIREVSMSLTAYLLLLV